MRRSMAVLALLACTGFGLAACSSSSSDGATKGDGSATTSTTTAASTTSTATSTTEAVEDELSVDDWTSEFCGHFRDWRSALSEASAQATSKVDASDLAASKAAFAGLFADASSATSTLVDSLKTSGPPDIEDGDRLIEDLVAKFQALIDAADAAGAGIAALDVGASDFESQADALIGDFQSEVTKVSESFDELDAQYPSKDLGNAVKSACGL